MSRTALTLDEKGYQLRWPFLYEGDGATIVRLLDEMPLSTEQQPTKNEGLVPRHFAYRVEGSNFAETLSKAWKEVHRPVHHYEFITGSGCMDVLSKAEPSFEVVDAVLPIRHCGSFRFIDAK